MIDKPTEQLQELNLSEIIARVAQVDHDDFDEAQRGLIDTADKIRDKWLQLAKLTLVALNSSKLANWPPEVFKHGEILDTMYDELVGAMDREYYEPISSTVQDAPTQE